MWAARRGFDNRAEISLALAVFCIGTAVGLPLGKSLGLQKVWTLLFALACGVALPFVLIRPLDLCERTWELGTSNTAAIAAFIERIRESSPEVRSAAASTLEHISSDADPESIRAAERAVREFREDARKQATHEPEETRGN